MNSKSRQLGSQGKPTQPLRVSERIAQRRLGQPAKITGIPHTESSIRVIGGQGVVPKRVKPRQKKAPTSKRGRAAVPKHPRQSHKEEAARPAISREALKDHEKRTANEPLPVDLAEWKRDTEPVDSDEMPSTHDPLMPAKLDKCGVFDEKWDELAQEIEEPGNFQALKHEIALPQASNEGPDEDVAEYREWFETISVPSYGEADATSWCKGYLDIPAYRLKYPHFKVEKMKFEAPVDSQVLEFTPVPDYIEGITPNELPEWIISSLGCYVRPGSEIAIPNFIAEFKGKGSMQIAHRQARLDGAVAAQGYFKLLTLCNVGEERFDKALVGTIESNAETIVGNVHWAIKTQDKTRPVEYRMRRVFHHFTRGINRRDFLRCREQARRFRQHFHNVREDLLAKLRALNAPPSKPRSYSGAKVEELKGFCREKNLPASGNKADLIKRLKAHDAGLAITSNPVTPSPSISHESTANASRVSTATQENIHYSFTEPSTRRTRGQSAEEPSQESRHSKKRKSQ